MEILLVRHGEPVVKWSRRLRRRDYAAWLAEYERASLDRAISAPPHRLIEKFRDINKVFASTLPRAVETATTLKGDGQFVRSAMFVEAALPVPPVLGFRMTALGWGVWSRVFWILGLTQGLESFRAARKRAAYAADFLIKAAARDEKVALVAHGFFNTMIARELRRRGWAGPKTRSWPFWAARSFRPAGASSGILDEHVLGDVVLGHSGAEHRSGSLA
ncbi:MAG: histidine phosphatase family protein [Pseudomonadota bacterium]